MTTEQFTQKNTHLPSYDPTEPTENAVITRLAKNWRNRATVKGAELDLDTLYEPDRQDYPESILPFHDHPTYQALNPDVKTTLLAWGMVAFNRDIMDIEQNIANPGFNLLLNGEFPGVAGEAAHAALAQATVDEQYHTLMHLNSSAVIRRARGWDLPTAALSTSYKAMRHLQLRDRAATERFEQNLITLAFATVAEISISALLYIIADDTEIQPVHSTTARLHNHDEYCHASISAEMAKMVYPHLSTRQQHFFLTALTEGLAAFAANDFGAWRRIVDLVGITGGQRMIDDCETDPSRTRILVDYSGMRKLCEQMDVTAGVDFSWNQ